MAVEGGTSFCDCDTKVPFENVDLRFEPSSIHHSIILGIQQLYLTKRMKRPLKTKNCVSYLNAKENKA